MILGLDGYPTPPSEIVERLKRIDGNLGIKWQSSGGGNDGLWAITYEWSPTDRRREGIQQGKWKAEDAHDIIVFLPIDCPVDEAYGYFVNNVRNSTNKDVRNMLDRCSLWNAKQKDANWQPVMDEAMEKVEGNAGKLFEKETGKRVPRSFGGLDKPKGRRSRKGKG